MLTKPRRAGTALFTLMCAVSAQALADNQQLKEAQQKLNQQVLDRPFSGARPGRCRNVYS